MSKLKKLGEMSRDELAGRTYQRIAYRKLVDLQTAVRECKRRGYELGVLGELQIQGIIEDLVRIAGIEYRSVEERSDYEPAMPLDVGTGELKTVEF